MLRLEVSKYLCTKGEQSLCTLVLDVYIACTYVPKVDKAFVPLYQYVETVDVGYILYVPMYQRLTRPLYPCTNIYVV